MKTKMYIMMLVLGCLLAMLACAAQEKPKEESAMAPSKTDTGGQAPEQKPEEQAATPPPKSEAPKESVEQKPDLLKTELEKISYVIGTQIGQTFKTRGIEIEFEPLVLGIKDAMAGKDLALTQAQMQQVMATLSQRRVAQQKQQAAKNLAEGKAFLEANKAKEGVQVLPSGLQYKVIKEGTGKTPTINDKVKAHYRGTFVNGTEFDSSFGRGQPAELFVKRVIPGWTEALQLIKEGGKWQLFIPANLAYGEKGQRGIPPNTTLIFEIELIEVLEVVKTQPPKPPG